MRKGTSRFVTLASVLVSKLFMLSAPSRLLKHARGAERSRACANTDSIVTNEARARQCGAARARRVRSARQMRRARRCGLYRLALAQIPQAIKMIGLQVGLRDSDLGWGRL